MFQSKELILSVLISVHQTIKACDRLIIKENERSIQNITSAQLEIVSDCFSFLGLDQLESMQDGYDFYDVFTSLETPMDVINHVNHIIDYVNSKQNKNSNIPKIGDC